jgi:uncharacterized protein YndB with AHSA1/START domain
MSSRSQHTPHITFPSELDVLVTRAFDAPIELVFAVLTEVEHMRHYFAPYDEEIIELKHDFQVGGDYRYTVVTADGREMIFSGTFLEIAAPSRFVQTWLFNGWPDAHAIEAVDLAEADGVTTLTSRLSFRDSEGRAHMTKYDGIEAQYELVDAYLRSLTAADGTSR